MTSSVCSLRPPDLIELLPSLIPTLPLPDSPLVRPPALLPAPAPAPAPAWKPRLTLDYGVIQAILDYMEKVEVHGLDHRAAQKQMRIEKEQEQARRQEEAAAAAAAAAADDAVDVVLGEDGNSMASWDAASLGGMGGDGASFLSLGTLANPNPNSNANPAAASKRLVPDNKRTERRASLARAEPRRRRERR